MRTVKNWGCDSFLSVRARYPHHWEIIGTITIRITISYTMKYTSLNVTFFSSLFLSIAILLLFSPYFIFVNGWCVVSSWNQPTAITKTPEHKYLYYQRFDELSTKYSLFASWFSSIQFLFGNYFLCILCKCFTIIVIIVMIIIWVELYYPHVENNTL